MKGHPVYAIRRTIVAFLLGALIFGAPYAVAAPPAPKLAAVLASGNDANGAFIINLNGWYGPSIAGYLNSPYVIPDQSGQDLTVSAATGDADANGGQVQVFGGGGNGGANQGAAVIVGGGGANNTGGNVTLIPGPGSGGQDGLIILSNLPMADPYVSGALWNDNGTVRVSAG